MKQGTRISRGVHGAGAVLMLCLAVAGHVVAADWTSPSVAASPSEGEMSYSEGTGRDSTTVPMKVLGGVLGERVVQGVKTELFVLQAENPERLGNDAANHLFTVVLKSQRTGDVIEDGTVTLGWAAQGKASGGRVDVPAGAGLYRAGIRLPASGRYIVSVHFSSSAGTGEAQFPYVFEPASVALGGHAHHH